MSFTQGAEANSHLRRCANDEEDMPWFVFLDLKTPGIDGFHVLDWRRRQPKLRRLMVVLMSTSTADRDVTKAFELGADAYLPEFPPLAEVQTIFQLANAMLSMEELERVLWPGLPRPETAASQPRGG